jgi:hypothetical protein
VFLLGNETVTFYELDSKFGHDTFLLDVCNVGAAVKVSLVTCIPQFYFKELILSVLLKGHLENSIF